MNQEIEISNRVKEAHQKGTCSLKLASILGHLLLSGDIGILFLMNSCESCGEESQDSELHRRPIFKLSPQMAIPSH